MRWHLTVSFGGREPFRTLLCGIFTFDDGKIASLLQFCDTAWAVNEMKFAQW